MEAVLIVLIVFGSIVAVIVGPFYFRARSRTAMLETLRTAYERGHPVPPDLIEQVNADPKLIVSVSPEERSIRDLRGGVITLAVALAMVVFGWAISFEEPEALYIMTAMAAFPGFVGLALIAFGVIGRMKSKV
jgi:hypothetical protein